MFLGCEGAGYNGNIHFFWQLRRLVAGRSNKIFQFSFLQSVLHKNEQPLKYLTKEFLKKVSLVMNIQKALINSLTFSFCCLTGFAFHSSRYILLYCCISTLPVVATVWSSLKPQLYKLPGVITERLSIHARRWLQFITAEGHSCIKFPDVITERLSMSGGGYSLLQLKATAV